MLAYFYQNSKYTDVKGKVQQFDSQKDREIYVFIGFIIVIHFIKVSVNISWPNLKNCVHQIPM